MQPTNEITKEMLKENEHALDPETTVEELLGMPEKYGPGHLENRAGQNVWVVDQ